jgi:hypothetical protein
MSDAFLPSEQWHTDRVHWHAFIEKRHRDTPMRTGYRSHRLRDTPKFVLWSPEQVAAWIDARTRDHVTHTQTWAAQEQTWVTVADRHDLNESLNLNVLTASRGDSIYVDVHTHKTYHHDLFVEALTHDQCTHHCVRIGHNDPDNDI